MQTPLLSVVSCHMLADSGINCISVWDDVGVWVGRASLGVSSALPHGVGAAHLAGNLSGTLSNPLEPLLPWRRARRDGEGPREGGGRNKHHKK